MIFLDGNLVVLILSSENYYTMVSILTRSTSAALVLCMNICVCNIEVATVSAKRILSGESISDWFPIFGSFGKPPKHDCDVRLEMRFTRCEDNPVYRFGIAADPDHFDVRECYFPVRHGGSMTLYQDADILDADIKRWSSRKERKWRALFSIL